MPRVYIVNVAGHDYSLAKSWGELVPLTTGHVSQGSLDRLIYDITKLNESTSEDWLLPSGLLVLNVIASAYWLRKHKQLRLLVHDRKNRSYREMTVTGDHLDFLISTARQDKADGETDSDDNKSSD